MHSDHFWTSQDGQILSVRRKDPRTLALTLAFWPRHPGEWAFLQTHASSLHFTERSTLARIGIEMMPHGTPHVDGRRLILEADAFLFDESFPHAAYWSQLLRPGVPVGRLFYAPASAKLTSTEIWEAVQTHRLKLPASISIDRHGRVFLTPHALTYTLNPRLTRPAFERMVSGDSGRSFLDKVQIRHEASPITIAPRTGILTSCSMYLKEHYVRLNPGEGNFGIHTSAVLLDPIKTFGTNVMLEIYNHGEQPVVNPMVSLEIYRAPAPDELPAKTRTRARVQDITATRALYECLDARPVDTAAPAARPRTRVSVRGQSSVMANPSVFLDAESFAALRAKPAARKLDQICGHRTMIQALDAAPAGSDTLVVDYFPNLLEHVEILTRLAKTPVKRLIFRRPSRTHGFFFSSNAHARLDTLDALGIKVYWFNPELGDLYLHTYKKSHGFFLREEICKRFQESTILAFYGSAVGLDAAQTKRISSLIDKLSGFIGPNVGVLTGGGGGVMRLATEQAREKGALTGACFLELEAQPPEIGVDFFNTFQETSRHFRQKWFEVADFCIFNTGGVGTLEEIGIELCNLKLGIRPRVPYVFMDRAYFSPLRDQLARMVDEKRAPAWMLDYVLFTDDPDEVLQFYRRKLQVL
ncbi:DNA-binding protein [Verrucomicrobia bacterium IMCC26134]|jgi:predicted Rossmann-fold nucleotide-binding protein|nr:DNA-binding protein [Verrucomicrobia bacterium IMCC26134]